MIRDQPHQWCLLHTCVELLHRWLAHLFSATWLIFLFVFFFWTDNPRLNVVFSNTAAGERQQSMLLLAFYAARGKGTIQSAPITGSVSGGGSWVARFCLRPREAAFQTSFHISTSLKASRWWEIKLDLNGGALVTHPAADPAPKTSELMGLWAFKETKNKRLKRCFDLVWGKVGILQFIN